VPAAVRCVIHLPAYAYLSSEALQKVVLWARCPPGGQEDIVSYARQQLFHDR
jgi:hypothetical protein